jgi:hypothetical protein
VHAYDILSYGFASLVSLLHKDPKRVICSLSKVPSIALIIDRSIDTASVGRATTEKKRTAAVTEWREWSEKS